MSYPRFIGRLEETGRFVIEGDEFHHAKVRRIKQGDKVEINTLGNGIYLCEVTKVEKGKIIGSIIEPIPLVEEKVRITLYQCVPNHLSKIDNIIEPISELGVYELVPVLSAFSAIKEKDVLKKIKKWEKIALNSIKQCKRAFPLKIEKPIKLVDIKPSHQWNIVFYEKSSQKLACEKNNGIENVGVLIGAEGGLTREEIEILKKKGFEPFSLGRNILRLETAVVVGVCQVKFILD
ncbi:MAG: 16S rRNA (uracil(1498)-N(3))-methyltransferase [Aquificae bacterium]|nr:16S rRNA (uracil(1498)-N(3))-methyltransferase [Aquificota bacterium]